MKFFCNTCQKYWEETGKILKYTNGPFSTQKKPFAAILKCPNCRK